MKRGLVWVQTTVLVYALFFLFFGLICWVAPHWLFSSEGFRTVSRAIIGILGSMSIGLGLFAGVASFGQTYVEWLAYLRIMMLVFASLPAVAFVNLGAVEPLRQATGVDVFTLIGINFSCFLVPVSLAFFALKRALSISGKGGNRHG
jgi:hypothetical protein